MKRTLKEWRRSLGVCCIVAAVGFPVLAQAQASDPPAQEQQVDPAQKKLLAATGLYNRGLFKPAIQEYSEFLDQYPNHAQAATARYALAICHFRLREFDKASEQLRTVLSAPKFDKRDEALALLGHCELSQNHFEPALAEFDELLAKYPDSKQAELAELNRAQTLYFLKKYPEAEKGCERYLAKYAKGSSRGEALYFQGLSQRAQEHNEQAVKTLEELASKYSDSPHLVDALLVSGQAQEAMGHLDDAADAYRQMLAAAPETRKADAHYSLGIVLYKAGKFPDAVKELTKLVKDFPSSNYVKPAKLQLGLAQLAARRSNDARNTLSEVVRDDPAHAGEAQYGLAQCEIADKRFEQARQILDELSRVQPPPANLAQVLLDKAACAMELNQFQQASDELEKLRGQFPSAPQLAEATYRQAFCLHKLEKFDQSHELCQQAEKLKAPELAQAILELDAEDLYQLKKYPEAQKQFAALADAAKDESHKLRFTLRAGQCEYFAGDYSKAVQLLMPIVSSQQFQTDASLQDAALLLGDALLQEKKYSEAIAPLKQYLTVAKAEQPQARYKLAIAQLHSGDNTGARQSLAEATQGPPQSPWVQRAWFERGRLDLNDKKFDDASNAFNRVLSSNPSPEIGAPATYELGWAEFGAKHYPQAASAWNEMAAKYPNDQYAADASFQRGVALHEAKSWQEALDALQSYASAHPDGQYVTRAKQLSAGCLKELGRKDDAAKMLAELATTAKGAGADSVLYDLAWAQQDAKDTAAAEATYRRLITEHPESKLLPAARTELGVLLYTDKKYDQAAQLFEQVIDDKSADANTVAAAQYRLGFCYHNLNKPDKAAATLATYTQKGAGTDEMQASALLQSGIDFAQDGRNDKAEQALSQMLAKFPNHADAGVAMIRLGQVQAEQNEFDASARTYQQFVERFAQNNLAYKAHFGIGWALENQKQYDAARKEYQKVIDTSNSETAARAQFQIGETYLAEGKFDPATKALLAVEDVYNYPQWSARALYEAGRAFEQLKQLDRARQEYTEILKKYKDSREAAMAQDRLKSFAVSP